MPTFSRNIIISLVLAIAAAGALFAYTAHVRDSANSGSNAIKVIVATHEVPVGTSVDQARSKGYLSYQTVRRSDLADGAVTNFAAVTGQVVTPVAVRRRPADREPRRRAALADVATG